MLHHVLSDQLMQICLKKHIAIEYLHAAITNNVQISDEYTLMHDNNHNNNQD